jgi:flagellar motility protein MotE (MotC chaperone)
MAEKAHSKIESILYIFVIPLVFTLILCSVVLSYMGYPVIATLEKWGNKIPVVQHIVPGPDEKQNATPTDAAKTGKSSAETQQGQKQQDAKQQPNANQKELADLKQQNEELQKQLDQKQKQQNQDQIQQAASLYANMSGSKAANILEALPLDQAALTISGLDEDQQSSILGSFKDPKKAANISTLLAQIAQGNDADQIKASAQKIQASSSPLTDTISAMPPAQSAVIIQNMMTISPKDAMDVMKNMNTNIRSQVLTEVTKLNPKVAATISANLSK